MSAPITNIPFSNPLYRNHNFYRRYGKRALDFTGALFGLICLFPVLAILAILLAIVQRTLLWCNFRHRNSRHRWRSR